MIIAANWKLHYGPAEAATYFQQWIALTKGPLTYPERQAVFFTPPYCWATSHSSNVLFGAQNIHTENSGAFTGENSASVLKAMGGQWVLVGHSERRQWFGETSEVTQKKISTALSLGLKPLLCIGETLEERKQNRVEDVLKNQLSLGLKDIEVTADLALAYEPIWAIGTGLTASTQDISATHSLIQTILTDLGFKKVPAILYGGSVKPENAAEILSTAGVSGLLVGGASLKPDSFFSIFQG